MLQNNHAIDPVKGYVPPVILLNMAAREFAKAHRLRSDQAPKHEVVTLQSMGSHFYRAAADLHWSLRGRP